MDKKKKKSEYLKRGGERERASAREKGRGESFRKQGMKSGAIWSMRFSI